MRKRRLRKSFEEPVINITPLVDVVFVVLFTFIIVAPLLEIDAIQLAKSGGAAKESALETSPVALHVFADNSITLNKQKIPLEDLPAHLAHLHALHPKARAQVYHDKQAHFGTYQKLKNTLESTGFTEMDIILKP